MSSLNAASGAARVITRPPMSFREPFEVCQRRSPPARLGQQTWGVIDRQAETQGGGGPQLPRALCNNGQMWMLGILMSFIFY